jgi:protein-S-isoprenylcysteine O-methyltransferase Ste14
MTRKPQILPPKGLLIAMAAQLPLLAWSWPPRPSPFDLVAGSILLVAGAVLNIWSERLFRRGAVGVRPFTPAPRLITSGPYRLTRNPMYLGLVFLNLGATFVSGALLNVWTSICCVVWLHYAFVIPEEVFLQQHFRALFDEYAQGRPRWLIGR